jgi:cob(I)alamin adenosyltransferase
LVKINKIYTRTGDTGETGLVGGARVAKDSLRVEAYGAVDELNSHLGACRTLAQAQKRTGLTDKLEQIQNELFDIGAELATPPDKHWPGMICVGTEQVARLEQWIDQLTENIPELRSFVLPGGSELNSALHLARTVCRRAERTIVKLSRTESVSKELIVYINRLSDLLFAMARFESHTAGLAEYLWKPGKK